MTAPIPTPPSRIRIYFHTPVTADDAKPITPQSSFSLGQSSDPVLRKGKRKKLEDDDGDLEDGRGPPPPPPGIAVVTPSVDHDGSESLVGRDSVAPSVAETASEADWLMAAIGEDEGEGTDCGDGGQAKDHDISHHALDENCGKLFRDCLIQGCADMIDSYENVCNSNLAFLQSKEMGLANFRAAKRWNLTLNLRLRCLQTLRLGMMILVLKMGRITMRLPSLPPLPILLV